MSRSKRFHTTTNRPRMRNFSLGAGVFDFMADRKDINWSEVVENYLKVYIFDVKQQEEQKKDA